MTIPPGAYKVLLEDSISRDRTTARRAALLEILLQERYLRREQLITRVEGKLGKGCFGDSAWEDTFYRDMQVVKSALEATSYHPAYSRNMQKPGYYLREQLSINDNLSVVLDGSVAEVDEAQISIFKNLTPRQRFQQGCSITNLACRVAAHRVRLQNPQLSLAQAQRLAIQKKIQI